MAFLAVKLSSEVSKLLHKIKVDGEKTPLEEFHITLICFDDNVPMKKIVKIIEAAQKIASTFKPFSIEYDKVSCFPKTDKCPIICPIDSKELQKLHKKLAKELDENNVSFLKTFKTYRPHSTLSYADNEIEDFTIDPVAFEITEIELFAGDEGLEEGMQVIFPLEGGKTAKLIDNIEKYANLIERTLKSLP